MTLTIWVDDWQIQCCGERFAPGGRRLVDAAGGRSGGVRPCRRQ
ncbi:DUF6578 domain-containing protein [Streptomyces sp. NPDC015184]